MIATLPMYDRPETAAANDALWAAIRARLGFGPAHLTRADDLWSLWRSPELLLAQTCGLPFRAHLHDRVALVGTPDYGLPDCPPGYYRSVFVARDDSDKPLEAYSGHRFAYNEPLSQSGWAAPQAHMQAAGLEFGPLVQTGAHRASARAVAEGNADFAALDALTWALIREHDAFSQSLRVVAETTPTPGLPFITARTNDTRRLFGAIAAAIGDLTAKSRKLLYLKGIVDIPKRDYLAQPLPSAP